MDNYQILWNCYKKSIWLEYFLDTRISNNKNCNNYVSLLKYVDDIIDELMIYYSAFNQNNYNNHNTPGYISDADDIYNYKEIENFENQVIIYFNNKSFKQMVDNIINNYNIARCDLSHFVLFWIMLYNCGYLQKNFFRNSSIHYIFEERISSICKNTDNEPSYYNIKYGLLPLVSIYCGMGFNYDIMWDFNVSNIVGFIKDGSSAIDSEINYINIMNYVNKPLNERKRIANIKKNKKENVGIKDYLDILNSVINNKCDLSQLFNLSVN
jgi:hypothetical protein